MKKMKRSRVNNIWPMLKKTLCPRTDASPIIAKVCTTAKTHHRFLCHQRQWGSSKLTLRPLSFFHVKEVKLKTSKNQKYNDVSSENTWVEQRELLIISKT